MLARSGTLLVLLIGISVAVSPPSAGAEESAAAALPLMAQNPQDTANTASPWKGLYFGSEVFGVSRKGGKGGFGGGGYIGYNRQFENNVFVGVQANAGYMPSLSRRSSISGYDYISASMKAGYDFGRVRTYVTAGFGAAAPTMFGGAAFAPVSDSINGVFNARGRASFTTLGAGVDYKITENLSVGVAVSVHNINRGFGQGLLGPGFTGPNDPVFVGR